MSDDWVHVGSAAVLSQRPLHAILVDDHPVALSFRDGTFGAITGRCPHRRVLLGEGKLEGDQVTCPSHEWRFHRCTGEGEFAILPAFAVKVEEGEVWVRRWAD